MGSGSLSDARVSTRSTIAPASVRTGLGADAIRELFQPLVESLLTRDDYMLLADYHEYVECQEPVDALFAVGRGQRELIIGDRATGKTAIGLDTIINQKHSDVICVYVAIGQRATAVRRVIEAVHQHGAPERCIFVVASAAASPGIRWIAPFAGFTIAEYFRDRGQHALIILDDLTKHAATHRELALLTREPPGREAYPGDIFYLHSRMLECSAKLSAELGSGSLTALPIAETDAGNLSAYIPTNLISITDGQIVLDSHLFAANQRPAVDVASAGSAAKRKQPR
jgi:F-type H+/Na+-transporting ATPase subunit alpha